MTAAADSDTNTVRARTSVSLIIPTRGRPADLRRALTHLLPQTRPPDEVLVVDDSPDDASAAVVAALACQPLPFRLRYHRAVPPPDSLPRKRNLAVSLCTGDYVLFMDDDACAHPDFVAQMTAPLDAPGSPYAGGSGMWTDDAGFIPLHQPSQSFKRFFCMGHYGNGRFLPNGLPRFPAEQHRLVDTEIVSGCCMIFRRELCERYRFDDSLNGYAVLEDIEFSYRVSREHRFFFNPAARICHRALHTTQLARQDHARMFVSNYLYHFRKNVSKTPLAYAALGWSFVGLVLRALHNRVLSEITGYLLAVADALRHGIRPGPAAYR